MVSEALVARIDRLKRRPFEGSAYRHLEPTRDPLSGVGARTSGGRWNPRDSFSVLYLGTSAEVVEAEFRRMASRQRREISDFLPRRSYTYKVRLAELLDLTDPESREELGLTEEALHADDLSACQEVGEGAHYAGFEGILAPSATNAGTVLAIFLDNVQADSLVEIASYFLWEAPGDVPQPDPE